MSKKERNIRSRYGYIIQMVRNYPYDKQLKNLLEDLQCTEQMVDVNWWIKGGYSRNEPALKALIKKEQLWEHPKVQRLLKYRSIMKQAIKETDELEWKLIKAVYRDGKKLEVVAPELLYYEKDWAYENVVTPFFERVEEIIWNKIPL